MLDPVKPGMKFFLLSVTFIILLKSNGQDCKKLEATSYSGLKFGSDFRSHPLSAFTKGYDYHLHYDSLDKNAQKRYSSVFKFLSISFSHLIVRTTQQGQIYSIELWTVLRRSDWKDSANSSPPPKKFAQLYKSLEASYGKPTTTQTDVSSNAFVKKTNGITSRVGWECTDIRLRVRVTYASEVPAINVLSVEIKDPGLELSDVLQ